MRRHQKADPALWALLVALVVTAMVLG